MWRIYYLQDFTVKHHPHYFLPTTVIPRHIAVRQSRLSTLRIFAANTVYVNLYDRFLGILRVSAADRYFYFYFKYFKYKL